MWRRQVGQAKLETEFLVDVVERVEYGPDQSDQILRTEADQEPLIFESLGTPQTPTHHAEGPFLRDHLRLMLRVLYAVVNDQLHLTQIEELARLKGFEGEVKEIEETIKENSALFEVFVLVHDAAKWTTVYFDAPEGSRGRSLGFLESHFAHRHDIGISERAKFRSRYLELYEIFAGERKGQSTTQIQKEFYLMNSIDAHYANHDKLIHARTYRELLERVSKRHRLALRNVDLLETLIAHHLDPITDFRSIRPQAVLRYHALAVKHGYDADDFIDLLQGCVFLDTVCASKQLTVSGLTHDMAVLTNFLQSEHDFAPWRRTEKERVREDRRTRERNTIFREVGLDGIALMDLLEMEAGPKFGQVLRHIHEAIVTGNPLPHFKKEIDAELAKRVGQFYEKTFLV